MEAVVEYLILICCAEAAAQIENSIVIIQRQMPSEEHPIL